MLILSSSKNQCPEINLKFNLMKKPLLFILLIGICMVTNLSPAKGESVNVGPFNVMLPNSPMIYENGRITFSWSISGTAPSGVSMDLIIESNVPNIAVFGNSSTLFSSTWSGQTYI